MLPNRPLNNLGSVEIMVNAEEVSLAKELGIPVRVRIEPLFNPEKLKTSYVSINNYIRIQEWVEKKQYMN